MFETAELGRSLGKSAYRALEPVLREELLQLQRELLDLDHSQVIVVFAGVDGAGKGETVNVLNEWMDPRWLVTRAFEEPTQLERERPEFWRYWLALPPRGRIAMFLSSWYSQPVLDAVYVDDDFSRLDQALDRIVRFEAALAADNATVLKFWMHLSHDMQKTRLQNLEADPLTAARVTGRDWRNWENYERFIAVAERVIMRTNIGVAPWQIVEGADPLYRAITVGTILRDTLRRRIDEIRTQIAVTEKLRAKAAKEARKRRKAAQAAAAAPQPAESETAPPASVDGTLPSVTVLSALDMRRKLAKKPYRARLSELQAELHLLHREARRRGVSSILVFEGPDAAGKGGAIRRINSALDPRNYQVHGVAAPTDEERAQHYLWRFWRHLSRAGRITIFDRSWYGRVLVERVLGFASDEEWRRAYAEINDFEQQLCDSGVVLVKYWLHITEDEQLRRFKARETTPYKSWKLTEEDWRNRAHWDHFVEAVDDMVKFTSTQQSPWTLVEGNDKRFARIKVLATFTERLRAALEDEAEPAAREPDG